MKKPFYALFLCVALCGVAFCEVFGMAFWAFSGVKSEKEPGVSAFGQEETLEQQNAFRIIRQTNADGQILLAYIFPVNSSVLMQNGANSAQIATYKFYLSSYVGALARQQKNKNVQGVTVSEVAYFSDVDGIGFSMVFQDAQAQKNFYESSNSSNNPSGQNPGNESSGNGGSGTGGSGNDSGETGSSGNGSGGTGGSNNGEGSENAGTDGGGNGTDIGNTNKAPMEEVQTSSKGFFIKRVEYQTNFPISSKEVAENFMSVCKLATTAWCSFCNLSSAKMQKIFEDSVFVYDTASTSNTLKSANFERQGNLYHNIFCKTLAEIEQNPTITFYATYPNVAVWYVFALLATAAVMTIVFVVCKRQNKKIKPKKPSTILQ